MKDLDRTFQALRAMRALNEVKPTPELAAAIARVEASLPQELQRRHLQLLKGGGGGTPPKLSF